MLWSGCLGRTSGTTVPSVSFGEVTYFGKAAGECASSSTLTSEMEIDVAPTLSSVQEPDAQATSHDTLAAHFNFPHMFSQENPGDLHDFYEVQGKKLGEGAFGTVRRARCRQSGMERAVKSVSLSAIKNLGCFEREVNVAKTLDHPNIARLFETFRDSKHIHLVIELCTGGELFDRVIGTDGIGEVLAATYTRQILAAISYLHAQQLVHRDVKPENFLLQGPSSRATLKMIDFGLARRFERGRLMYSLVGTACYVAPQVLQGGYDERCDVWSAGVVLYIMLCGYPPFYGDTDVEIFRMIRQCAFDITLPEWHSVSADAKDLVTLMLLPNGFERPSADALLASPWFRCNGAHKLAPVNGDFVVNLQKFQACVTLKKVALTAVAQQLPDQETQNLQSMFRSLDMNCDGMLSTDEIRAGLLRQGLQVPKELEEILDKDGSGHLSYSEFLAATMDQTLCTRQSLCKAAFRVFDLDGDGKITKEELVRALSSGNGHPSWWRLHGPCAVESLIQQGDANGDGCIDFEEFCAMIAPIQRQPGADLARTKQPGCTHSRVLLGREGRTAMRLETFIEWQASDSSSAQARCKTSGRRKCDPRKVRASELIRWQTEEYKEA